MTKVIIDTNVVLRFLLADIPDQFETAKNLFLKAKDGKLVVIVSESTIFESFYVLEKYYGYEKIKVVKMLRKLVKARFLTVDSRNTLLETMDKYEISRLSIADCYLLVRSKKEGLELLSFDKKLMSAIG